MEVYNIEKGAGKDCSGSECEMRLCDSCIYDSDRLVGEVEHALRHYTDGLCLYEKYASVAGPVDEG